MVAAVFEALDTPALSAVMGSADDTDETGEELHRIEAKLVKLGEMWAADELSRT